jgi:hypothetical protein
MPHLRTLHVEYSEGVVFDDLKTLNMLLEANTDIRGLFDFMRDPGPVFHGFLKVTDGAVTITSNEEGMFSGYRNWANVWGCFTEDAAELIAKHMTEGRLVFRRRDEDPGVPDKVFIIQPGTVNH